MSQRKKEPEVNRPMAFPEPSFSGHVVHKHSNAGVILFKASGCPSLAYFNTNNVYTTDTTVAKNIFEISKRKPVYLKGRLLKIGQSHRYYIADCVWLKSMPRNRTDTVHQTNLSEVCEFLQSVERKLHKLSAVKEPSVSEVIKKKAVKVKKKKEEDRYLPEIHGVSAFVWKTINHSEGLLKVKPKNSPTDCIIWFNKSHLTHRQRERSVKRLGYCLHLNATLLWSPMTKGSISTKYAWYQATEIWPEGTSRKTNLVNFMPYDLDCHNTKVPFTLLLRKAWIEKDFACAELLEKTLLTLEDPDEVATSSSKEKQPEAGNWQSYKSEARKESHEFFSGLRTSSQKTSNEKLTTTELKGDDYLPPIPDPPARDSFYNDEDDSFSMNDSSSEDSSLESEIYPSMDEACALPPTASTCSLPLDNKDADSDFFFQPSLFDQSNDPHKSESSPELNKTTLALASSLSLVKDDLVKRSSNFLKDLIDIFGGLFGLARQYGWSVKIHDAESSEPSALEYLLRMKGKITKPNDETFGKITCSYGEVLFLQKHCYGGMQDVKNEDEVWFDALWKKKQYVATCVWKDKRPTIDEILENWGEVRKNFKETSFIGEVVAFDLPSNAIVLVKDDNGYYPVVVTRNDDDSKSESEAFIGRHLRVGQQVNLTLEKGTYYGKVTQSPVEGVIEGQEKIEGYGIVTAYSNDIGLLEISVGDWFYRGLFLIDLSEDEKPQLWTSCGFKGIVLSAEREGIILVSQLFLMDSWDACGDDGKPTFVQGRHYLGLVKMTMPPDAFVITHIWAGEGTSTDVYCPVELFEPVQGNGTIADSNEMENYVKLLDHVMFTAEMCSSKVDYRWTASSAWRPNPNVIVDIEDFVPTDKPWIDHVSSYTPTPPPRCVQEPFNGRDVLKSILQRSGLQAEQIDQAVDSYEKEILSKYEKEEVSKYFSDLYTLHSRKKLKAGKRRRPKASNSSLVRESRGTQTIGTGCVYYSDLYID